MSAVAHPMVGGSRGGEARPRNPESECKRAQRMRGQKRWCRVQRAAPGELPPWPDICQTVLSPIMRH
eukprot:11421155-Heterocapsa_arctica.AAC.1